MSRVEVNTGVKTKTKLDTYLRVACIQVSHAQAFQCPT